MLRNPALPTSVLAKVDHVVGSPVLGSCRASVPADRGAASSLHPVRRALLGAAPRVRAAARREGIHVLDSPMTISSEPAAEAEPAGRRWAGR
ncbi:hypothetical protein GCM10010468_20890 [Actinocorallia longicatena]|uniref:Uncharacterized protein n=1 Tax=Actinocorallia longicatena TaxID=111803 RepID=A0ABP6Q661_9ACTN